MTLRPNDVFSLNGPKPVTFKIRKFPTDCFALACCSRHRHQRLSDLKEEPVGSRLERAVGRKASTNLPALACCSHDRRQRVSNKEDKPIGGRLERSAGPEASTDLSALACCSRNRHQRISDLKEGEPIGGRLERSVGPKVSTNCFGLACCSRDGRQRIPNLKEDEPIEKLPRGGPRNSFRVGPRDSFGVACRTSGFELPESPSRWERPRARRSGQICSRLPAAAATGANAFLTSRKTNRPGVN